MEKIIVLTKDDSLKAELEGVFPRNYKLLMNASAQKEAFIFFDIDSIKPGMIRDLSENNFVVAVTRQKWTAPVMEASTFGAYEVVHRPLAQETVLPILSELSSFREELQSHLTLASLPPTPTCAIVGQSPIIMDVCKKLARLSQVDAPVLITGETGTGKELIAESIAQLSSRFGKPFVVVNCAAVPENLLESELFGFEKGSFTGAVAAKEGILKIADEGSVFFDEVGELPLALQGKLLRFLQTQTFYPIGSTRELQVNVRVISATNRDLGSMVKTGTFRDDLYHRLSVTSIHIPPLRERKKDILPLVTFFVNKYKHTAPRAIRGVSKAFLKKLASYEWPGNIRELENSIRSALALSKTHYLSTYELKELGDRHPVTPRSSSQETFSSAVIPFIKEAMGRNETNIYDKVHQEVDRTLLDYVLSATKDNQSETARILGINRLTLRKKLNAR
ncbi:MAG: sigma-54-dependent Fis family transcriptional regulator [Nitrospirae bacterium]|nr:MAG: sigma-54-dependent Fis family transcriptional regulator [Nitrospirota bacterium]